MSCNYARSTNAVVNQWFERVSSRAGRLCRASGRKTLSVSHIRKAVCLEFPKELAKLAIERMDMTLEALAADDHRRERERLH